MASFTSTATGTSTVGGFALLGLVLFLSFGIGVSALLPDGSPTSRVFVALALANPLLLGLFVENYLSQYFFVALAPLLFVLLAELVDETTEPAQGLLWALAAVAAAMIAVYPYFFAVLAAACVAALLTMPMARTRVRQAGLGVAVRTAVLVNLAFVTIVRYGETRKYEAGLDAIARNVLLGGWSRLDVAGMFAGFTSYQWRTPDASRAGLGASLRMVDAIADATARPNLGLVIAGSVLLLVAVALTDVRSTLARPAARIVAAVVAAWVVFSVFYGLQHRPYVFLKSGWVAAALLPCVLAVRVPLTRARPVALIAMAGVAMLWVGTTVADRMPWVLPRAGNVNRVAHVSAVPDLDLVRGALEDGSVMAIVRGDEPLQGSDRDRVLASHTAVIARDEGARCTNCHGDQLPDALDCATELTTVVVVGRTGQEQRCGLPLQVRGTFVEIYGR